jgi:hypothetical protein
MAGESHFASPALMFTTTHACRRFSPSKLVSFHLCCPPASLRTHSQCSFLTPLVLLALFSQIALQAVMQSLALVASQRQAWFVPGDNDPDEKNIKCSENTVCVCVCVCVCGVFLCVYVCECV